MLPALAVLVVLLAAVPLLLQFQRQDDQFDVEAASLEIVDWEAPSDFLMDYDNEALLATIPLIENSYPDWQ